MEVFDGNNWMQLNMGAVSVGLHHEAEQAIDWALKKIKQEKEWYELASNSEAVRIALDQLEQARTRVELTAILARDHEQTTS
jgi:prefoldin subunit 5